MFCIVAFMILGILGVFSATYRGLAREALDCVLRRVTLRPCTTGFDEKMKSRILGSVINRSETAARVLNKNFELFSWVFFLLMLASSLFAMRGAYLFYVTGSCGGANKAGLCLFDPKGENSAVSPLAEGCPIKPATVADLSLKGVNLGLFPTFNAGSRERIVVIGCYGCVHTRKMYASVKELALKNGTAFTFIDYPVKVRSPLMARLGLCVYQRDQAKYWKLNEILFAADPARLDDGAFAQKVVAELGLDWGVMSRCLSDPATQESVNRQMEEISKSNFFGTPTVFVDDHALVGPKPYRVYAISLNGLLYWWK